MSLSTATSSVLSPTSSVVATTLAVGNPLGGVDTRALNVDEWEKERIALYQQLDEKVINSSFIYRFFSNDDLMIKQWSSYFFSDL